VGTSWLLVGIGENSPWDKSCAIFVERDSILGGIEVEYRGD
jgi:hypothetical protein